MSTSNTLFVPFNHPPYHPGAGGPTFTILPYLTLSPPITLLLDSSTKGQIKSLVRRCIYKFYNDKLRSECSSYSSLSYFTPSSCSVSSPHPIIKYCGSSFHRTSKAVLQIKLLSGRYRLQYLRSKFYPTTSPNCVLCSQSTPETISHFVIYCPSLDPARSSSFNSWTNPCDPSSSVISNHLHSLWLSAPDLLIVQTLLDPPSSPSSTSTNRICTIYYHVELGKSYQPPNTLK